MAQQQTADRPYPLLDTVRVALIGYGGAFNIGRTHGNSMLKTGKMQVVAICDKDPARAAAAQEDFPGVAFFTEVDTMLAEAQVDLCAVILPHHLHAPVAIQCLEAGRHVVVEKPMCLTDDEAQAMIKAADKQKVMLSVFHNRRWDGDYLALREIVVAKKLIGDVYHIEMFGGSYAPPRDWWRAEKRISGGLFYDWGAHYLDWLLNLIPQKITGVTGFFHKLKWHQSTNEDNVEAAIRFEDGTVAHVQWSALAMAGKERWRLLGTEGAVVSADGKFIVTTEVHGYRARMEVPYKQSNWDAYYANIAAHLVEGDELVVKPEQARRVIAVMEAAETSSLHGKTEPLAGEGTGR